MPLPFIGIPTHNERSKEDKFPPRYAMSQSYTWAVEEVGGAPFLVPLLQDKNTLRTLYDQMDGLLLAGGGDLDPARYGEAPHPNLLDVDVLRDRVETIMTQWALAEGKPLLAICRGVQMLNVTAGGTLYQDLPRCGRRIWCTSGTCYARATIAPTWWMFSPARAWSASLARRASRSTACTTRRLRTWRPVSSSMLWPPTA